MQIDYNKLKTFLVVAEMNSFTRAASELARSQSAISQQIQALEEELGVRLLERKSKKIFLSPEGIQLFACAKDSLSRIDDQIKQLKDSLSTIEGHISLGVVSDGANKFEAGYHVGRFLKQYPQVNITVSYGTNPEIEQGMISGKLDLGVMVYFQNSRLFQKHALNWEEHYVYTTKKYLSGLKAPPKNHKDLIHLDLIDLTDDFACFETFFKKNSPSSVASLKHRKPSVVVTSQISAMEILLTGFGIAVLPNHCAKPALGKGLLVRLFENSKPIKTGLDIAFRTGKTQRLVERLFIEEIIKNTAGSTAISKA